MVAALAARNPLEVHSAHAISSCCIFPSLSSFLCSSAAASWQHCFIRGSVLVLRLPDRHDRSCFPIQHLFLSFMIVLRVWKHAAPRSF
jgi:hypothetical protein